MQKRRLVNSSSAEKSMALGLLEVLKESQEIRYQSSCVLRKHGLWASAEQD